MMSDTIWELFGRGVDWGVDRLSGERFTSRSLAGFSARFGRLGALDVPVALYLFVWTHEYGHKTRANERGFPAAVAVFGSPWTLDGGRTNISIPAGEEVTPALYSAGIEATNVIVRRLERRMFTTRTARHTELAAVLVATNMGLRYIRRDLSARRVAEGAIFERPSPADPAGYVITIAERRFGEPTLEQLQAMANDVRRQSWWNLVDYGLVTLGMGLFADYLWRGERDTPIRWLPLGSLSLIPSVRYELTPIGPERQVRSYVRAGETVTAVHVRWTERVDAGRLVGGGVDYVMAARERWRPAFTLDVWKNPDGTIRGRAEAGADVWRAAGDRWHATVAFGGKGSGYLIGFPEEGGLYASVGMGVRF